MACIFHEEDTTQENVVTIGTHIEKEIFVIGSKRDE
jgi:hypothetical protein